MEVKLGQWERWESLGIDGNVNLEKNKKNKLIDKKSNLEGKLKRNLIKELENRKIKFVGHVLRHNNFLKTILEGKIIEQKGKGRRKKILDDRKSIMGVRTCKELKITAMERVIWLQRKGR